MFVNWTYPAVRDLEIIGAYIRQDSRDAAHRVLTEIFTAVESLSSLPNRGRLGRLSDTRELVLTPSPYIAVYRVLSQEVRILRIRHAARKWPYRSAPE